MFKMLKLWIIAGSVLYTFTSIYPSSVNQYFDLCKKMGEAYTRLTGQDKVRASILAEIRDRHNHPVEPQPITDAEQYYRDFYIR